MIPSRSVRSWRSMATAFSWIARHSAGGMRRSTRASVSARRARLITRSPTLRISSSRRVRSTRTKCDGATPPPVAGSPSIAAPGSVRAAASTSATAWLSAPTSMIGSTTMPSARHASSVAVVEVARRSRTRTRSRRRASPVARHSRISPALDSRCRTVSTRMPRATRSAEGENVQRHRGLRDCRGAAVGRAALADRARRQAPSVTTPPDARDRRVD